MNEYTWGSSFVHFITLFNSGVLTNLGKLVLKGRNRGEKMEEGRRASMQKNAILCAVFRFRIHFKFDSRIGIRIRNANPDTGGQFLTKIKRN